VKADIDAGWRPANPPPVPEAPQPQWGPPPQTQWPQQPSPRPSNALLWVILVLLVINLGLTLYVFGVVHNIVSGVQSAVG
jgi:hypothetical protein